MSDSGQPSGQQTVIQNNDPPAYAQPYLQKGLAEAERTTFGKPLSYYPDSTVVPFSNQTQQALTMAENRAATGSPLLRAGQNAMQATAQGNYLNSNPYFNQAVSAATRPMVDTFRDTVMPSINSAFQNSGRYGSGLQAYQQRKAGEQLARSVGDVAGSMAYQNYGNERGRQLSAAAAAPSLAAADYQDIGQLERVGGIREAQAGAQLQDDINRYMHGQQAERDAVAEYLALVGGGTIGGRKSTSQPIYRNQTASTLGNLATAAGTANTLFGADGLFPRFSF